MRPGFFVDSINADRTPEFGIPGARRLFTQSRLNRGFPAASVSVSGEAPELAEERWKAGCSPTQALPAAVVAVPVAPASAPQPLRQPQEPVLGLKQRVARELARVVAQEPAPYPGQVSLWAQALIPVLY